jgi:hypothetical protein
MVFCATGPKLDFVFSRVLQADGIRAPQTSRLTIPNVRETNCRSPESEPLLSNLQT